MNVVAPFARLSWVPPLTIPAPGQTAPVAPSAPAGPAGPAGPTAPVAPSAPAGPAGPAAPVAPSAPAGPAGPSAPAGPTAPVAPSAPAGPAAPVAPSAPAGPTAPVAPSRPGKPMAPVLPGGPAGPGGPAAPARPAGPVAPSPEPVAPVAPVGPTGPLMLQRIRYSPEVHGSVERTIRTSPVRFPTHEWIRPLGRPFPASAAAPARRTRARTTPTNAVALAPPLDTRALHARTPNSGGSHGVAAGSPFNRVSLSYPPSALGVQD